MAVLSVFAAGAQHRYSVNVGQFDKIQISDKINVIYTNVPDSTGMAAYTSDRDMADAFIFTNKKGTLKISISEEYKEKKEALPVVNLYSDFLLGVENSAECVLRADLSVQSPTFSARLVGNGKIIATNLRANEISATLATGNGTIALEGKCSKASYKMVGAGLIQADAMEAEVVKCIIAGTGSIGCWAEKNLDVRGIGSTKIYYKGQPEIKKVGGGKIFPLTAADSAAVSEDEPEGENNGSSEAEED